MIYVSDQHVILAVAVVKEEKTSKTCEVEKSGHPPASSHMTTMLSKCLNSWIIHNFWKEKLLFIPVWSSVRDQNVQLSYPVHLSLSLPPPTSPRCGHMVQSVVLSAPDVSDHMKV